MSISPDSFFSSIPAPAESFLRRRAPLPKVCFTILFLVLTVSFSRYALAGTVLFATMPFLLAAAAKLPVSVLLFRIIPALPFILCTGIANLFFDHAQVAVFSLELSGGTVALLVLIAKTLASVGMVLVLTSTTAFRDLAGALRCLHVPCLLILVLQQLFRYLALLAPERLFHAQSGMQNHPAQGMGKPRRTAFHQKRRSCRRRPCRDAVPSFPCGQTASRPRERFAAGVVHRHPAQCSVMPIEENIMKIQLENLTLERPGGVRALNGITLDFDSDRCAAVALLGENGAGKSSLLESIVGLITVHSGRILVDGMPLEKKNLSQIRRKIGMVFQNPDHQLFSQTVKEDVAFGPSNLNLPEEEIRNRVENALKQMNILPLAGRDVTQLSGGEKRRAALAGVLAMKPEAILLDEPTAMLDPRAGREFAAYLQDLPVLKIIATHDLTFAARVCPECVILQKGKIAASGKTADILNRHDLLLQCGLE